MKRSKPRICPVKDIGAFNKLYDELSQWIEGSDQNGSLEFAFRNGFDLHAVSLWQGSGASALNVDPGINRKAELREINRLCKYADIFVCKHCNHHSFFLPGEIEDDQTQCESCLKVMDIDSRGSRCARNTYLR